MPSIPRSETDHRIKLFQEGLARMDLDAALIVQRADLYYFSGTGQDAHLFIPVNGNPLLMARRSFERARVDSPLENVVPVNSLSEIRGMINSSTEGEFSRLGMELDVLPVNNFRQYESLFSGIDILDVS
ncbi:MAG: aminopeptidase P family N-terminal domain-containing protein, partial [Deltaproteobacteria bacterium]|nr:aminopeptidase P family N-terminal domain-containing protein [Deltaproteobacteria bacterium]